MKKIASSSWVITLISTMIGVIAGFYLTDFNERRKLNSEKSIAFGMVTQELEDNYQNLKKFNDTLNAYLHPFKYVISLTDRDMESLIIPKDSLDIFMERSKKVFLYESWEPNGNDSISIKGDLSVNFESKLVIANLSHLVWDSYKQSKYLSVTPFKCLINLEPIYNLQQRVDEINQEWFEVIYRLKTGDADVEDFIKHWELTVFNQQFLLEMYDLREELTERCKQE